MFLPQIGGVQIVANSIAEELTRRRIPVSVVTRESRGEGDVARGYEVLRIGSWCRAIPAILAADVVILLGPIIEPLFYARLAGRPVVVSNHMAPVGGNGRGLRLRLIAGLTRRTVDVACSRSLANALGRPASVVPNPLREDFEIGLDDAPRPPSILFAGRFIPEKGGSLLLEAFAVVAKESSTPTLTFVGEGPERDVLKSRARELGLSDRVSFLNLIHGADLQALYRRHSVVAVPSTGPEAFGLVVLEGLASGCRLVVSNRGGLPEAVGPYGIVVDPTIGDIAAALSRALADAGQPRSSDVKAAIHQYLNGHRPDEFVSTLLDLAATRWPTLGGKMRSAGA